MSRLPERNWMSTPPGIGVFGAEGTGTLQTEVSQKYQVTGSERQVWDRLALNNDYICFSDAAVRNYIIGLVDRVRRIYEALNLIPNTA